MNIVSSNIHYENYEAPAIIPFAARFECSLSYSLISSLVGFSSQSLYEIVDKYELN